MAKPDAETGDEADETITRGTGNVFADLGYPDADERQTKLRLAHAINGVIVRRRLTQAAAPERLRVSQPKISALANYTLGGFSVERLMTFLTALDQDVEIVIKTKPRSRKEARIVVVRGQHRCGRRMADQAAPVGQLKHHCLAAVLGWCARWSAGSSHRRASIAILISAIRRSEYCCRKMLEKERLSIESTNISHAASIRSG